MNIKKLAHKVYYSGYCPSHEEEEALLSDKKYGKVFKGREFVRVPKNFDSAVDSLINNKPASKGIGKARQEQEIIDSIISDTEDQFGFDIDNQEIGKITKLNSKIGSVKSFIVNKIKESPLGPRHKQDLIEEITPLKDMTELLHVLYIRALPSF